MKRNINTIQNVDDINLSENTKKYLIEALANLGQRYSIKGDGISIRVSKIGDLIEKYDVDPTQYIVQISKVDGGVQFDLLDNTLTPVNDKSYGPISIETGSYNESVVCAINELGLEQMLTLYMYANENYFIYSGEEKFKDEIEEGNTIAKPKRFVCEKYDKYTNQLVSSITVLKTDAINNYNYVVLYLYRQSSELYYLNIYNINTDGLENFNDTTFAITKFANHDGEADYTFSPESFLSELYAQCQNERWNGYKTSISYTDGNDSQTDVENFVYRVIYNQDNGSFKLDTNLANYFENATFANENALSVNAFLQKIASILQYEQYNKAYLYKKLKTQYSNDVYKSNNVDTDTSYETLFINVLKNLFLYTYNGGNLYVPIDYEFEYAYNTNNPWQIYYSAKDICIHDVSVITNDIETVSNYKDKSGLIRVIDKDSSDVEKSTFYNFYVEPDPNENTDVYSINISKHFAMPYISETGYWVVDDIETSIYAKGKDAGNPNITILKSDPSNLDRPEILTSSDRSYLNSLVWKTEKATIQFPKRIVRTGSVVTYEDLKVGQQNVNEFECYYYIPDLSNLNAKQLEEHIDRLKYCIFLNISTVDSIENTEIQIDETNNEQMIDIIKQIYGDNGVIMTFWTLVDNGYVFKPIMKDETHAADVNYMTNLYNIVGYAISNYKPEDPDNFMFTHLVFDNVSYRTKNQGESTVYDFPVYPVIKTVSSASDKTNQMLNNFNLKIEYNDTIDASYYYNDHSSTLIGEANANYSYTSYIKSITQSDRRWFDMWNNDSSEAKVSNEEYTYNVNGQSFAYLEYLPNSVNNSVPMLDLSEIFIKDNTSLNKVNIVSFDSNSNSYYSYIGTSHDTNDKSYLTIGTAKQNINIGTNTLVDEHKEMFNKQAELHIEFDNTRITSYSYIQNDLIAERDIITYATTWRKFDRNNTTYWNTKFCQNGVFSMSYAYCATKDNDIPTNLPLCMNDNTEFIVMAVPEKYGNIIFNMYIADMVNIPVLISTISPTLVGKDIIVKSNNDVISYEKNDQTSYVGVRLNSRMLDDYINYDSEGLLTFNSADNEVFTSNELDITYYIGANNVAYFTINDITNSNTMSYIHKLQTHYTNLIEPQQGE